MPHTTLGEKLELDKLDKLEELEERDKATKQRRSARILWGFALLWGLCGQERSANEIRCYQND